MEIFKKILFISVMVFIVAIFCFLQAQKQYSPTYVSIVTTLFPKKNVNGLDCKLRGDSGEWGVFYGYIWDCEE